MHRKGVSSAVLGVVVSLIVGTLILASAPSSLENLLKDYLKTKVEAAPPPRDRPSPSTGTTVALGCGNFPPKLSSAQADIQYGKYRDYIDQTIGELPGTAPLKAVLNPHAFVAAIATEETSFEHYNPDGSVKRGSSGEYGIMQIMPIEIEAAGKVCKDNDIVDSNKDLEDVLKNVRCGVHYLNQKLQDCGNILEDAATAYNSGRCDSSDKSYGKRVIGHYEEWKKCIKQKYLWPVLFTNSVSGYCFGDRAPESRDGIHKGIDAAGRLDDKVMAIANGIVVTVVTGCSEGDRRCGGGLGNYIKIKHDDGLYSVYSHLSKVSVQKDKKVEQGSEIGTVGNTGYSLGAHLHFEIHDKMDTSVNPCNFLDCSATKCR